MNPTRQPSTFASIYTIPLSRAERLQTAAAAGRPLLEAARPLLQALRDPPADLDADAVLARRQRLLNEARAFERVCAGLMVPRAAADDALYCLCSALDEAAMQTAWGKGAATGTEWSANGLATTLGYDRQGDDRVFGMLNNAMRDPDAQGDMLELLQEILACGFEGRYRRAQDGSRRLQDIRNSLGRLIRMTEETPRAARRNTRSTRSTRQRPSEPESRSESEYDIDVVAFRMALAPERPRTSQPRRLKWLVFGALAAALLAAGAYFLPGWYASEVARRHVNPIPAVAQRIESLMPVEIATHAVSLQENDDHSRLVIRVDGMFARGEFSLNPAAIPPLSQIGHVIAAAGPNLLIHLTGYTDNTPLENTNGLTNQSLSALRAQSVMKTLTDAGISPERITVNGNGESSPLDDNNTLEGRARNRRVEIAVEQWR
ncbi:MAG TPA: type IVB secretion system protein IcmH/DotU [Paraburkholderia sp.]|uniref:type IVB secretion system protein IcmH/DotU n=1 Tax=Paraburkholderia sp. TaxID=1926495 RepID=UPI002BBF7792|nr:type IVB secretion system protein IcmH/DotU [Paraburkholderia sp.]HTR11312.1 type IVB secretion system protein IcmH/DotU [Paraburkholderia sp.]